MKQTPSPLKFLFPYLLPHAFLFTLGVVLLFSAKAIEVWIPIYVGKMVTLFANKGPFDEVQTFFYKILFMITLSFLLEIFVAVLRNTFSEKVTLKMRKDLLTHLLAQPLSFFSQAKQGHLFTSITHDTEKVKEMLSDSTIALLGHLALFLAIFIGILVVNPWVGLGLSLLVPPTLLGLKTFQKKQQAAYANIRCALEEQNNFLQEHISGHNTVRSYMQAEKEEALFSKTSHTFLEATKQGFSTFLSFTALIDFLLGSVWILGFLFFLLTTYSKETPSTFDIGGFFTFTLWGLMLLRPLSDLAERYNILLLGQSALKKLITLFASPKEETGGQNVLDALEEIVFENVTFGYDPKKPVLLNLSFSLKKGERIGLVGLTGSGKTTLFSLLLGFYRPTSGAILLNGKPLESYTLNSVRKAFATVVQDPLILSGSVRDNLLFFREDIVEENLLSPLPHHNLDDKLQDEGKDLSRGERQLIGLKRASVSKATWVLLDEATASLDPTTEYTIQQELKELLEEKSSMTIAHRLSTLKQLDRLLVLHEGKLQEEGSFSSLLEKKGLFYHLWQLQA